MTDFDAALVASDVGELYEPAAESRRRDPGGRDRPGPFRPRQSRADRAGARHLVDNALKIRGGRRRGAGRAEARQAFGGATRDDDRDRGRRPRGGHRGGGPSTRRRPLRAAREFPLAARLRPRVVTGGGRLPAAQRRAAHRGQCAGTADRHRPAGGAADGRRCWRRRANTRRCRPRASASPIGNSQVRDPSPSRHLPFVLENVRSGQQAPVRDTKMEVEMRAQCFPSRAGGLLFLIAATGRPVPRQGAEFGAKSRVHSDRSARRCLGCRRDGLGVPRRPAGRDGPACRGPPHVGAMFQETLHPEGDQTAAGSSAWTS